MKRFLAVVAFLALGACSTITSLTSPVSVVKAQQTIDLVVATHKTTLQAEVIYLLQPPCGLKASPAPPLCASYAVGLQWKAIDDKVDRAVADAQAKINALGTDPTVLNAAIAAAQLAMSELSNFSAANGAKK